MSDFYDLPFSFVMELHRTRKEAEKNNDITTVEMLRQQYPDLFEEEFEDFMLMLKIVTEEMEKKYQISFTPVVH